MAKVQLQSIDKEERYEMIGELFDIVTRLRTKKEIIGFLMGLLTPSEALMLARRIQIAELLTQGENYEEIARILKTSPTTVNNIAKELASDELFQRHIEKQVIYKSKQQKEGMKRSRYDRILNPYGQLKILRDLLDR